MIRGPWPDIQEHVPAEPGIYIMRDRQGEVVYVGKAVNLRSRLRSYLSPSGDGRAFVRLLDSLLGEVETIVVSNEKEALLLENTLIKRYQPRFNVRLRDDKGYPVLRVDLSQSFPRVELVRRIGDDNAQYFGPYPSARSVRQMLRLLNRHFKLRTCSDHAMALRSRPCLQHEMGRCSAPCAGLVEPEAYGKELEAATLFIKGRTNELLACLGERMQQAANSLAFEEAARLRDQIRDVEAARERQRMVLVQQGDQDFHALARAGSTVAFSTLFLRHGSVWGQRSMVLEEMEFPDQEVLSQYINLFYDSGGVEIPPKVVVPRLLEDAAAKAEWLSEKLGSRVRVLKARRGDQRRLLEMAARNAQLALMPEAEDEEQRARTLARLAALLGLPGPPRRMECVDISAFHGEHAVGSVVAFQDCMPDKARYRRYRIRSVQGNDDLAMMREVLSRRLRGGRESEELPDLLVLDGGKGQLGVAMEVLEELKLERPALVALAKSRTTGLRSDGSDAVARSEERVFLPGQGSALTLPHRSPERYLLERIRDEAHRFALTYHRKTRTKSTLKSCLDEIQGVGPARRRELLRRFGSVQALRAASPEEVARLAGFGTKLAERILQALGRTL